MISINQLLRRDDAEKAPITPTMASLLIALLCLAIVAILAVVALFVLRHVRRTRKAAAETLPLYNEKRSSTSSRRLTITTSHAESGRPDSVFVSYDEKRQMIDKALNPPDSPVPEIRITFPEEVDESGKRQSGRVVVVRVGETSIGLEPLQQEDLPPYQRDTSERFQSLDLERIGGLKEKDIAV